MNTTRFIIALLLAPLVTPILLFPYLSGLLPTNQWLTIGLLVSVIVTIVGIMVLGVPAYLVLRGRNLTGFWLAPLVGFASGAAMWLAFSIGLALALDQGIAGVQSSLTSSMTWKGAFWPGGVIGAAVGIAFWLIARPDRYQGHG